MVGSEGLLIYAWPTATETSEKTASFGMEIEVHENRHGHEHQIYPFRWLSWSRIKAVTGADPELPSFRT